MSKPTTTENKPKPSRKYVRLCPYLFDLGITITRRDGNPIDGDGATTDKIEAGWEIAGQIDELTNDGGISVVEVTRTGALWIQGPFEASADNPLLLQASAEILGIVEKLFSFVTYDVQIEWAEIDESYEKVEDMKEYEPFLVVKTSDNCKESSGLPHPAILVRRDYDNNGVYVQYMRTRIGMNDEDIQKAIRAAAEDFLKTKDGRAYWEDACAPDNFSYGDVGRIPVQILRKHGIEFVELPGREVEVDEAESLGKPARPKKSKGE